MALTVTLLGVSYSIPETSDVGYDTALTSYLKALATAFPQLNGGVQSLTAELDFGTSFGIKALYLKSETALPASAGQARLAKTDTIKWRNNANGADLALAIDTGDALLWNGANVTGNPSLGANTTAAQSIPNNASTIVVYGTVEKDSDSGYNSGTGRYTVPTGKGGDYLVIGEITYSANVAGTPSISIFKNGVEVKRELYGAPLALQAMSVHALLFGLVATDIIDIRTTQVNGAPVLLSAVAAGNYLALKRIPT